MSSRFLAEAVVIAAATAVFFRSRRCGAGMAVTLTGRHAGSDSVPRLPLLSAPGPWLVRRIRAAGTPEVVTVHRTGRTDPRVCQPGAAPRPTGRLQWWLFSTQLGLRDQAGAGLAEGVIPSAASCASRPARLEQLCSEAPAVMGSGCRHLCPVVLLSKAAYGSSRIDPQTRQVFSRITSMNASSLLFCRPINRQPAPEC